MASREAAARGPLGAPPSWRHRFGGDVHAGGDAGAPRVVGWVERVSVSHPLARATASRAPVLTSPPSAKPNTLPFIWRCVGFRYRAGFGNVGWVGVVRSVTRRCRESLPTERM